MKLNLGKRIVLFVHWLASLLLLAMLTIPSYTGVALSYVTDLIPSAYMKYVVIGLIAVYLLLSLDVLCIIFKRSGVKRAERGFITVDSADTGKVRIAISAIEQMVKQAAHTVDGIADMKIGITNTDDAIAIQLNVAMVSGSHVPTVTLNLQRAIRQFVEMNCGVAVQSVSVSIQSVANPAEGGKKGKRHEAKAAQEWSMQPVSAPTEPAPVIPTVEPAYEPASYEVVPDEESAPAVEEPVAEEVPAEVPVESPADELNTEEEKEN